ncbi:hypothetical protein C3K47_13500 [Solitalea longa]|uniref:Carboxypeptidase regulatory-like domain-containing protein n=1 Tax=Solitalea longa TaxID=2079460 RepID=A0A2S4ZZJ8_9SPHI|nr:carboxypeptidase regulatory-like domain-containing protein [Solitalea longa]POY35770.1 hypothetical protein C3K47_13500 [Solitalea longa]
MKTIFLICSFLLAIILPNGFAKKNEMINLSDSTGVRGSVVYRSGNYMPTIGETQAKKNGKAVEREIVFYELTNANEATANGSFYTTIKTKEIKRIRSDKQGRYTILLQPGTYSVFVKEKEGYFANRFDGHNNICPVEVRKDKMTVLNLIIDYNAAY